MVLAEKIKALRKERDWTQKDLANFSGVDRGAIASIETGKAKHPRTANVLKLAHAFSIPPEDLYHAAGYIRMPTSYRPLKETPEDILERLRVAISSTVPIYEEFRFHSDGHVEPMGYVSVVRERAKGRNLECYIVRRTSLEPEIKGGDIIIVDRHGRSEHGDIIACLEVGQLHLARLREMAGQLYLESNRGTRKIEEAQLIGPVIEVRRRLK